MNKLIPGLLLTLLSSPLIGQVCNQSFTLRETACPAGALDCTNKGSRLTKAQVDTNFVNVIDLCAPFDVAATATTVQGDWTFANAIVLTTGISGTLIVLPTTVPQDGFTFRNTADTQNIVNIHTGPAERGIVDLYDENELLTVRLFANAAGEGKLAAETLLQLGDADSLANSACISVTTDRLYHDTNCNNTKDGGEEFLDASSSGDSVSIDGVEAVNPDFVSDGDLDAIRCTGAGVPDASCVAADDVIYRVQADSVALDTDTTGEYVDDVDGALGFTIGESIVGDKKTETVQFDYTQTLAGDPALAKDTCIFTTDASATGGGILCEGAADGIEGLLVWNPTVVDSTLTLPTNVTDVLVARDTLDTLTNKTLTTPTIGDFTNATHDHQNAAGGGNAISGKQDRNNVAVDDDDCTGEQGWWWYDTTDSAFEFCNANSGAPTVLGGGGGAWTDGTPVVLNTTTKDVVVGTSQVNTSKLTIDGDDDQVQLTIQAFDPTPPDSLVIVETSGGVEIFNIDNSGDVLAQSIQDIDGPGTNWSIDSAGDATFNSVTSAASASPTVTFDDSDSGSETQDATISANATDVGAGTEDVDVTVATQVNSTLTNRIVIDADGQTQILNAALEVDATDPADSGAIRLDNNEALCWEASPAGTDVCIQADASEFIQITGGGLDAADITTGLLTHERGGMEADVSGYTDGLYGMNAGATTDIDTIAEFDTALGLTGTPDATTFLRGDGQWAAPSGSGDVTAVGSCTDGECFTDGDLTSGTTLMVWEGNVADAEQVTFAMSSAEPAAAYTLTFPDETGTVCTTGSVCTGYDPTGGDDLSDDNPTALQNVTTINDGDYCQGNASSGFDCDISQANIPGADHIDALSELGAMTCTGDQYIARNTGNTAWECVNESAGGGTTIQVDGAGGETTMNIVSADSTGIDWNLDTVASPDEIEANLDLTEINDTTFGDNTDASLVHTVDPTGTTNPAWTYTDGNANLSAGNLQEAGVDVVTTSTDDDIPEAADYSNLTAALGLLNSPTGTIDIDYSQTRAGNPGLAIRECIFASESGSGGGAVLCEGSVADDFEGLYSFPNTTGADQQLFITALGQTIEDSELEDMAGWTVKMRNAATPGVPADVLVSALTEETTPAAGDWLLGENSTGSLRKFDVGDLPTGTGDVTDVGDCVGPACFTSGSPDASLTFDNATSGTVTLQTVTGALGTVTVSLPAETGTVCTTGSVCTGYDPTGGDDLSDDNPTALQNVNTITDGSYCQGAASSGFDCDVLQQNIPGANHIDALSELGAMTCTGDQYIARNTGNTAWECVNESAGGGTTIQVDGAGGESTMNIVSAGSSGIDVNLDTVPSPDEIDINLDLTEITGAVVWGDGTQATQTETRSLSGATDPVWTYGNNQANLSTGVLQEGGNAVVDSADDITALSGVTTINDGDYCQGGTTNGMDCDVTTIPAVDGGTGQDSSGSTGIPEVNAGVWSFAAAIADLSDVAGTSGTGNVVRVDSPTFTTAITVPNNSISDEELDEGATFSWTGAHTWASAGAQTFQDDVTLGDGATGQTLTFNDDGGTDGTIAWNETSDEFTLPDNSINTADLATEVRSMHWGAGSWSVDGTNCSDPAETTINSGPELWTVICNTASNGIAYGNTVMPDSWDGGTVTFELSYVQTAADTNAMNSDIDAQCRGTGETISGTWGTPQTIDDAGVTGSSAVDQTTSAAVTPAGTCAGGDTLFWRWTNDATATTSAQATLNYLGMKMEYTSNIGD